MKRNLSIDLVKIIAMYFVLALHLFNAAKIETCFLKYHWWSVSGIAIPLFFMVSGYLLCNKEITPKYQCRKIFGILRYVFITATPYVFYLMAKDYPYWYRYYWDCLHQAGDLGVYWYFGAMILIYLSAPLIKHILHSRYALIFLGGVIIVCHIVFLLNAYMTFERHYIPQMYRIWNWILYFSLGMMVRLYHDKLRFITWKHVLAAGLVCVVFMYSMRTVVRGNEYYFCSLPCMAYAFCMFVRVSRMEIHSSRIISSLSSLFLPIYTIHYSFYGLWKKYVGLTVDEPNLNIIVNYLFVASIVTILAFAIMKLPYANKVFRL